MIYNDNNVDEFHHYVILNQPDTKYDLQNEILLTSRPKNRLTKSMLLEMRLVGPLEEQ